MRRSLTLSVAALLIVGPMPRSVTGFPEYQIFSQENSGRGVSCAMCHVHPDGPEGVAHGQIGGLDKEALALLNEARGAFEPGKKVNSPILNEFGNVMVEQLGRKKLLELKRKPEDLAAALDPKSDLDRDGIPDAREFLDGTHPLHKTSGNPWLLFVHNFKRHFFSIVMVTLATLFLLYGFRNLHLSLESRAGLTEGEEDAESDDEDEGDQAGEPQRPMGTAADQVVIRPATDPLNATRTVARPLYLGRTDRKKG